MEIIFTSTISESLEERYPIPADKAIPEWYKEQESYILGEKKPQGNGMTTGTIKRCMPVFDALTAGYIIPTIADVYVSQKDGLPWYEWRSLDTLTFHPVQQAEKHPAKNNAPYPKWNNPWAIELPKGYSAIFVQPFHHPNKFFTILPGIVDSDRYAGPVNFPFVLNDVKFEGLIPAGTPMVQVIPFKRDSWKMKFGKEKDLKRVKKNNNLLTYTLFDSYKNKFHYKKEFK